MKSNSQLDLPSEYYIDSIVIKSKITEDELDISNIYNSIVIHEGITYNFIYGSISIFDTNGFIESLPIVGEEEISFKIKKKMTDEKYFEVKGNIYSITERREKEDAKSMEFYKINFMTELSLENQIKRVSKTYDGQISTIVENISKSFLNLKKVEQIDEDNPKPYETILIEETLDDNKINIPNLNPIQSINFLTKFAYSKNKNNKNPFNTTFHFYQTRQGYFFQSIENMITQQKDKKRKEYLFTNMPGVKISTKDDIKISDLASVLDYKILNMYDNFKSVNTGYYGGSNLGYDTLTKTLHQYDLNYNSDFDNMVNLDKHDTHSEDFLFLKNPEKTNLCSLPTKAGSIKSKYIEEHTSKDIYYIKEEQIRLLKNTKKSRLNNSLVMEITIPSNPYLYVNEVIKLKFPSFIRGSNGKQYLDDKYFSGDYIVIGIKHVFSERSAKTWQMTLTILKDSYKSKLEK